MSGKIVFSTVRHDELTVEEAEDLYRLRYQTFNTRLSWKVQCNNGLEYDKFDSEHTIYLLGKSNGKLVCSARFIDIKYNNMIIDIFSDYFPDLTLPQGVKCYDVSRLFIDKCRRSDKGLRDKPLCKLLFIAMIEFCMNTGYEGMYAVVSKGMYHIFRRSGWNIKILKVGISEKEETIYFIYMPATKSCIEDILNKDVNIMYEPNQFSALRLSDLTE